MRALTIARYDLLNILRDPMLRLLLPAAPALALVVRLNMAALTAALASVVDLTQHHAVITGILLVSNAINMGIIVGFAMLDERDEGILRAHAVTPLTLPGMLLHRAAMPTVMSLLLATITAFILAPISPMSWPWLAAACVLASLTAPLIAFALASLARNKVEGLAVGKLLGLVLIAPMVAASSTSPAMLLLGISPAYWAPELLSPSPDLPRPAILLVGTLLHLAAIAALKRLFTRRAQL
jgi:fluoroquinolone transport system permease protein